MFFNRKAVAAFSSENPKSRRNRVVVEESSGAFSQGSREARQPWAISRSPVGAVEQEHCRKSRGARWNYFFSGNSVTLTKLFVLRYVFAACLIVAASSFL